MVITAVMSIICVVSMPVSAHSFYVRPMSMWLIDNSTVNRSYVSIGTSREDQHQ